VSFTHPLAASLPLDEGIMRYVMILHENGVETYESCQGGEGHAFLEPTIRFHGNAWAGLKAVAIAMEHGLPVLAVRRSYAVTDGQLTGPEWEMTFKSA
jgi:hypothetical protein